MGGVSVRPRQTYSSTHPASSLQRPGRSHRRRLSCAGSRRQAAASARTSQCLLHTAVAAAAAATSSFDFCRPRVVGLFIAPSPLASNKSCFAVFLNQPGGLSTEDLLANRKSCSGSFAPLANGVVKW